LDVVPPVLITLKALSKIFNFLSSRRLAIVLALAVGVVAFVGVVVPQNKPLAYYEAHYKDLAYNVLISLGIYHIFSSWYFVGILIILAVTLAICTGRRVSAVVAAFRSRPPPLPFEEKTSCEAEIGSEAGFGKVIAGLRELPFSWREGGGVFYGRRKRFALMGTVLIHVSLLSGSLGLLLGVTAPREEVFVFEGERVALPPAYGKGFEVSADAVDVFTDANTGKVLSYRTGIRLFSNGGEVAAKELEISNPLRYRGLAIYQNDTASADAKGLFLEEVELKEGVTADEYGRVEFSWEIGNESGDVTMVAGEVGALGDTGLTLRYVAYFERFYATEASFGDDGADYNPTAFIEIENGRGDTAQGVVFKLHPEKSFYRAEVPDFTDRPLRVDYASDDGPWRAARRERVLASGSYVPLGGGDMMRVMMAGGEGGNLSQRSLEGIIERRDGRDERVEFPFGVRVSVRANNGDRIYRFMGSKAVPVTGLTVGREPGLPFFYAACLLFSVGVVTAALWRYDELAAYVRGGRVYLAARSSKGAGVIRPTFERWVTRVKENQWRDAA
jgi:cytochrome c biogenesis protein ResB